MDDLIIKIEASINALTEARAQIEWLRMQQEISNKHIEKLSAELTKFHRIEYANE